MSEADGEKSSLPGVRTPGLPAGYDAVAEAKRLMRGQRSGALATIARDDGHPFATLVAAAADHDGTPILLLSQLSEHTKNLLVDARASLLLAEVGKGDPLAHPRLTLVGHAVRADDGEARAALRGRFLAYNPKSSLYADFADFAFWRLVLTSGHLNGGFAKAASIDAALLLTPVATAGPLIAAEADAVAHMNRDHADALALYAEKLNGEAAGPWKAVGLDPEGLDLVCGNTLSRLVFPRPIAGPGDLRAVLVELAALARSR
jgi:putative heme iron utilization protein